MHAYLISKVNCLHYFPFKFEFFVKSGNSGPLPNNFIFYFNLRSITLSIFLCII